MCRFTHWLAQAIPFSGRSDALSGNYCRDSLYNGVMRLTKASIRAYSEFLLYRLLVVMSMLIQMSKRYVQPIASRYGTPKPVLQFTN